MHRRRSGGGGGRVPPSNISGGGDRPPSFVGTCKPTSMSFVPTKYLKYQQNILKEIYSSLYIDFLNVSVLSVYTMASQRGKNKTKNLSQKCIHLF